jgi:Leucine-rich repeat (LRR) protein
LSVDGIELKCEYRDYFDDFRCEVESANLSLKTIGASFTFSGSQEQKQRATEIAFSQSGRVAHLPRNLFQLFPRFTSLSISNSDIPILRNNFFQSEFSKLRDLSLTFDNINGIEKNAFAYLTNLMELSLYNNKIKSLPAILFQNNRKLRSINLNRNMLKLIHPETFKNLNQLANVYLRGNECIDKAIGCKNCSTVDHPELEHELQPCYENYKTSLNLLNEGKNNEEFNFAKAYKKEE